MIYAMNIAEMWNFQDPTGTEIRFRSALETASGDTALILQTQIARTHGIRQQFAQAREILQQLEPQLQEAGVAVHVYYWIEWGRTFCSATHDQASQTETARNTAREAFLKAFALAKEAKFDSLALDALHMMAFVDNQPEELLAWNLKTLAFVQASSDPEAKKWEGSVHHNVGYGLHQVGRFTEALKHFELSKLAREKHGDASGARISRWMTAWTLRSLEQYQEAIEIQLQLEQECEAVGMPDPYVFEELATLFSILGDEAKLGHYQTKLKTSTLGS